jgi:ATP-dependent RNA helicase DHX57
MEAVRGQVGGADVLPLHANLSSEDQRRVFIANPNKWKVVAATNVAEVRYHMPDSMKFLTPHWPLVDLNHH